MSPRPGHHRLIATGLNLLLVGGLLAACGTPAGEQACASIVEDFMPLAQDAVVAVDAGDVGALEVTAEELDQLEQAAIAAGCPSDVLAGLVAGEIGALEPTTEAGQAAVDDLEANGPFAYELPEEPSLGAPPTASPATTTTVPPPTTTTEPPPATTTRPAITLCSIDDGGALEEIFGTAPGEGRLLPADELGIDVCIWEREGQAVVVVGLVPAATELPERDEDRLDSGGIMQALGIDISGYATIGSARSFFPDGPTRLVLFGLASLADLSDSYDRLLEALGNVTS